jgi:RNA polymerase sigma-70 factor (ECF subfamily)
METIQPATLASEFDAHGAALVLYARQWLDRAAAEDVVQEAFVRLMGQSLREPGHARAWLYRTVRNAAVSAARSRTRRARRERAVATGRPDWFQPSPEDAVDAAAAQAALSALPAAQREVIVLRLWSAMTLAEIAAVTGLGLSTVHDHYRRGLAALKSIMATPPASAAPPPESRCPIETK